MLIEESLEIKNNHVNINDFITWKKNIPFLYQYNVSHILNSPSLSCQFYPHIERSSSNIFQTQKILTGTNFKDEINYLIIGSLKSVNPSNSLFEIPKLKSSDISSAIDDKMDFYQIDKRIVHDGPVLKARMNPNNSEVIATKAKNGKVFIYKINPEVDEKADEEDKPRLVLEGHEEEGWGLDWHREKEKIISGADDGSVCIWDMNKSPISEENQPLSIKSVNKNCLKYERKFAFHYKPINDIKFHRFQENIFSYVCDHSLSFWDSRVGFTEPFFNVLAHTMEVFALDFSQTDEFLVLTGGNDGLIKLWDMRNLAQTLYEFEDNNEHILKLSWCPNNPSVFASSSKDCRIKLWDLSLIDDDKNKEDESNEIFFIHSGHKGSVTDFSWNSQKDLDILSTDSKNQLQNWKILDNLYYKSDN
jgi:histone-binding protein RBBP4